MKFFATKCGASDQYYFWTHTDDAKEYDKSSNALKDILKNTFSSISFRMSFNSIAGCSTFEFVFNDKDDESHFLLWSSGGIEI